MRVYVGQTRSSKLIEELRSLGTKRPPLATAEAELARLRALVHAELCHKGGCVCGGEA